jgi:hypothetical protein
MMTQLVNPMLKVEGNPNPEREREREREMKRKIVGNIK